MGALLAAHAGRLATGMRGDGDPWLSPHCDSFCAYPRLACLSADQPILLLELGVTRGSPWGIGLPGRQRALDDVLSGRWPRLIGFSRWIGTWQDDDHPAHDTDTQLRGNPELARVFLDRVGENPYLLCRSPGSPSWPAH